MDLKNFSNNNETDYGKSWLLTYSDMITLVLCFFIIFFTFSAEEASMLENIKENLSEEVQELSEENEELKNKQEALKKQLFGMEVKGEKDDFIKYLEENELMDSVEIATGERGVVVRFKDGILFGSGEAELSTSGDGILEEIALKIKEVNNSIVIEGFTDNIPIRNSSYPSNWELSTDRAIGVAKYFIDEMDIAEERVSVSGHGEQKPIDTNETKEGRANNRRIEITILN